MRKHIGLVILIGLFSVVAFAQENAPKAEIFGGYQYTRFDGGVNANGWNTSVTGTSTTGLAWLEISAARMLLRAEQPFTTTLTRLDR